MNQYISIRVMTPSGYKTVVRLLFQGVPQVGHTVEFDGKDLQVVGVHWEESSSGFLPTVTLK